MSRFTCDGKDVTGMIQTLFDMAVRSTELNEGLLDVDTRAAVEATRVLLDAPAVDLASYDDSLPEDEPGPRPQGSAAYPDAVNAWRSECHRRTKERVTAQVRALAAALLDGLVRS